MKTLKLAALIASFSVVAAASLAATDKTKCHHHMGPRVVFKKIDANGDGKLTLEEFLNRGTEHFKARDANGDGLLSAEEMRAAALKNALKRINARIDRMLAKRDTNGDGQISLTEMELEKHASKLISRADTDGDGAVTKKELAKARKRHHRKWKKGPVEN